MSETPPPPPPPHSSSSSTTPPPSTNAPKQSKPNPRNRYRNRRNRTGENDETSSQKSPNNPLPPKQSLKPRPSKGRQAPPPPHQQRNPPPPPQNQQQKQRQESLSSGGGDDRSRRKFGPPSRGTTSGSTADDAAALKAKKKKKKRYVGGNKGKLSPEEMKERERALEEEREKERKRQEEEKARLEKERLEAEERERKRKEHEEKVREASGTLKAMVDATCQHVRARESMGAGSLEELREKHRSAKKSLKSDHKKCTAFVKKVKAAGWPMSNASPAGNEDPNESALVKDVRTLNLSRYVEEVAAALMEAKLKVADLPTVVALCTAMHERYEDFLLALLPPLTSALKPHSSASSQSRSKAAEPSSQEEPGTAAAMDKIKEASRQRRICLRLLTEFLLHGLVSETKPLLKVIADAAGAPSQGGDSNQNQSYNVNDANLIVSFAKAAGHEILGKPSRSVRVALELIHKQQQTESAELNQQLDIDSVAREAAQALEQRAISLSTSETLRMHCLGAHRTLCTSYVSTHSKLRKLEKRCEQDRLLAGSLSEAREKGLLDARKLLESLKKSVETLAEVLDEDVPVIPEEDEEDVTTGVGLELWTGGEEEREESEKLGPFDDEETREFYCDLPDLLERIPPALLGMTQQDVEQMQARNVQKYGAGAGFEIGEEEEKSGNQNMDSASANDSGLDSMSAGDEDAGDNMTNDTETLEKEDADTSNDTSKDTPHYKLNMLLEHELPECNRREKTDDLAEKFCVNHGTSKPSRKRLVKALFLVPRTRLDLLPYYARLTAILDRVFLDVGPPLVTELEQQFHGLARWKKSQNLEGRLKNARLIGELTKFRVAPPIVALRCLKRCLDDFSGFNIDVACCVLESCGRYLYRMDHTKGRISGLMDTMIRIRKAKNLDDRVVAQIDSAFFMVSPPQNPYRKKTKCLPPLEAYVKHLLTVRLNPSESSISFVVKQLQRLPWNNPSKRCGAMVVKYMLKACRKGRYTSVAIVSEVAAGLKRSRPEIPTRLIDAVIEELQWFMEHPSFRDQQRILTMVKLLGEMHRSALVPTSIIFEQLHHFINFGHDIPQALREASEKQQLGDVATLSGNTPEQKPDAKGDATRSPISISVPGRITQTIHEDEEITEYSGATPEKNPPANRQNPAAVAVSSHSKYDPRVPCPVDPPSSVSRIKLVCTLLETTGRSIVTSTNLAKLQRFMTAFQRYLFTKSFLPTDVEFSLLDLFDALDSYFDDMEKRENIAAAKTSLTSSSGGFVRYSNWIDSHNSTIAAEESEALLEARSKAKLLALGGGNLSDDTAGFGMDADAATTEDLENSVAVSDDEDYSLNSDSAKEDESVGESESEADGGESVASDEASSETDSEDNDDSSSDEDSQGSDDESDDSEDDDDSYIDEEEMDEATAQEAHMKQLEEEAFERELRKITMDALEKGKIAARTGTGGKISDTMVHASQFVGKKTSDIKSSVLGTVASSAGIGGIGVGVGSVGVGVGGGGVGGGVGSGVGGGGSSTTGGDEVTSPNVVLGGGEGINFKLLKRGHKGRVEAKYIVVPKENNLAKQATKQDDEAAKERDILKARVLQYEVESAEQQYSGNVYMDQAKLQVIRNRPLSMEDIDRNFGSGSERHRPSYGGAGGRGRGRMTK